MKTLPSARYNAIAMLAGFALASCAASTSSLTSDTTPAQTSAAPPSAGLSVAERDLTPDEK
jgi:hypothetical protein